MWIKTQEGSLVNINQSSMISVRAGKIDSNGKIGSYHVMIIKNNSNISVFNCDTKTKADIVIDKISEGIKSGKKILFYDDLL